MGKEVPLTFVLHNGGMRCIRVSGNLADDALRLVWTHDVVGYGVCYLLWPPRGVSKIITTLVFMEPWSFLERVLGTDSDAMDVAVDAAPPVLRVETILTGKQWLSYSILIRPGYLVAHSYADTAAVGGYVEIVFVVALCHMSGVSLFAGGPLEVEYG